MKRKGKKSKAAENSSNGVNDREDQNGETSDRDEQDSEQEDKRRRGNKRKSASKRVEESVEEEDSEESEPEEKKKKANKRKAASKKADEEEDEESEPEDKRKKANKRKSASKKADEEEEEDSEPEDKKKASKRKSSSKKGDEDDDAEETQYEVEQVLDSKYIQGVRHYLIRWKGYEPESDTWEPESTLNCPELISEFKTKQKKKGRPKKKEKKSKPDDEEVTWDENEDFEVDRILDVYFKKNGQREFLVSWKGYPPSQNSWEPEENMDCKDLIKRFMEKVEKAKQSDQRELRVNRTHTDRLTMQAPATGRRLSKRNVGRQRVQYHDAE